MAADQHGGMGQITGQCLKVTVAASVRKQYSYFRSKLILPEGEGPAADRNFRGQRSEAGLHASRDSFYRTA
jgi:hypothetical protein